MKLTYKLFAAFLVSSLLIVIIMAAVMQYYASRNFSAYVGRVEMEQLSDIMPRLEQEYRDHQGWEHVRGNHEVWAEILRLRPGLERPPFQPPPRQGRMAAGDAPSPDINPPLHDIRPRLTLFDRNEHPIMGLGSITRDHVLKPVTIDGGVVGCRSRRSSWCGAISRPNCADS